jgi:hypothetical protein
MHGRWAYISHLKFLQLEGLNKIIGLINGVFEGKSGNTKYLISYCTQKYHRYDNLREAQKKIEQHTLVSVTRHESGNFYMHVQPKKTLTHILHWK